MTEKRHTFCHAPTRGPDQIPHRCDEKPDHSGAHRCTCNYGWSDAKPSGRSSKPRK